MHIQSAGDFRHGELRMGKMLIHKRVVVQNDGILSKRNQKNY